MMSTIDEGDVDMYEAARVYKEVGYKYMLTPDHVPRSRARRPETWRLATPSDTSRRS